MKKKIMGLMTCLSIFSTAAYPCTRAFWNENTPAMLVGRTMDWHSDTNSNLWVFPRGIERQGLTGTNTLRWTSKYGSIIASVYDIGTSDGINEAGLNANILWLDESDYGQRDGNTPGLAITLWTQFFLDNFATVNDAVTFMKNSPFQIVTTMFNGYQANLHLSLADATGDSAIVEYIDGQVNVHHDAENRVMTNSPTYDRQLKNLEKYSGFGGTLAIPGGGGSMDRFVRASHKLQQLGTPQSLADAYTGIHSVIAQVTQSNSSLPTIWRTFSDLTNLVYQFESTATLQVLTVDLKSFDLSPEAPTMKLDLVGNPHRRGDVSRQFVAAEPFEFLP